MILWDRDPETWHFETEKDPWIRTLDFELGSKKKMFFSFSGSPPQHSLHRRAALFTSKRYGYLRNAYKRLHFRLKFINWYGKDLKWMILWDLVPGPWHFETDPDPGSVHWILDSDPRKRCFLSKFSGSTLQHSLHKRASLFNFKRSPVSGNKCKLVR